jgi:hypothetical protein
MREETSSSFLAGQQPIAGSTPEVGIQPQPVQTQQQTIFLDKPLSELIKTTVITQEREVPDGAVVKVVKVREVISKRFGNVRVMFQYTFTHDSGRTYLFSVFYSKAFLSLISEALLGKINKLTDLVGKNVRLRRVMIVAGGRRIERLIPVEIV